MGAALPSLLGKNELRNQTPIGQAALKVVLAQGEVVVFYDRLPPSLREPRCGDIDLLEHGQAACFKSGAHFRGGRKDDPLRPIAPPRSTLDGSQGARLVRLHR
jgi:hypothetical protein